MSAVTDAKSWKSKSANGIELKVPSGNVALVRRVGIQSFLEEGIIPNSLRQTVMKALKNQQQTPEIELSVFDEDKLIEAISMMDNVCVRCVVEPKVSPVPTDDDGKTIPIGDARRDPELLYVDEVDYDDKVFIWQFALGGTSNLDRFRGQLQEHVESVPTSSSVDVPAVTVVGD